MSRWFESTFIALVSMVIVLPVAAADLGGAAPSYEDRYANDDVYDSDEIDTTRNDDLDRYAYNGSYDTNYADRRDDGPRRLRQNTVFQSLKYDLQDAGYSRISYKTERLGYDGERVFYLTACANGVRYRLHVTADCEIDLKQRIGFCQSAYY